MKKQLFSLVMMLAIVVLAGTSAMAQVLGDPDYPFLQVQGSNHTFRVTNHTGSTYAWLVSDGTTNVTEDATHVRNHTAVAGVIDGTDNTFNLTWDDQAASLYYVQVTENTTDGCSTIRRAYVYMLSFDVYVTVSNSAGVDQESADPYELCGAGTVPNYGDIPTNAAFSQSVEIDGSGNAGNLALQRGTSSRTTRYISLRIVWSTPPATYPAFTAPNIFAISYNAAVTTDANTDTDDDFISIGTVAKDDLGTNRVTASSAAATTTFVSPLLFNARWGRDQTFVVDASDVTIYSDAAGTAVLGIESTSNYAAAVQGVDGTAPFQNVTDSQTILGAPATSVITTN